MAFLLSLPLMADIGPVGRSTYIDGKGNLVENSREQWFIYVRNSSGGALVDGDTVVIDTASDDGYSVTTSTTAGARPVCVLAEACANLKSCKCQTYGLKTNVNFASNVTNATAGKQAFISETFAGSVQAEQDANVGARDLPVGTFLDAATSSGDVELFIQLR